MSALYLLRHGRAEGGQPDSERPLSPEGWAQAAAVGRLLARLRPEGGAVLCSPARRCRETASGLGLGAPETDQRLALDRPTTEALALARTAPAGSVLVGHQPELLGLLAAWLPDGLAGGLALPPATLVVLRRQGSSAALEAYLEPSAADALAGRIA